MSSIFRNLSGAKIVYRKLLENNVSDVFIYSGGSIMPVIDQLYKKKINYYVNTHEQNCGHSATGYAKTSGKTGVSLVTSGPGITNMVTPLLDANNDSTPLVVISGQVNTSAIGTDAFQEAPATQITKHVTKWNYCVTDLYELPEVIDYAFFIANDKKKGSVHIDIPKNVMNEIYLGDSSYVKFLKFDMRNQKVVYQPEKYEEVANIINYSKKPILYVGQGCNQFTDLLTKFVEKSNIPITTTIHANGVYDETKELSLRWCGMHGYAPANYSIQESDCIIALGSRFDDRTTGNLEKYAPNAFAAYKNNKGGIIHVNIENSEINKVVKSHYNFNSCCGDFLENILPHINYNSREKWINKIENRKNKFPFLYKNENNIQLNMEAVLTEFNKQLLDKDCIVTTGVGNHQMQTYQFIQSKKPNKIISSGSLGVMGAGLPYAIGAQIANKNKNVILIDGDSSFNMTLSDLKTIKEYDLPIKIAIMNNSAQMMVTIWEKLFFNERYTATINNSNPNYYQLAKSFGIESLKCDGNDNLEDKIKYFLNYDGAILCEFNIKQDICLPLVAPNKALDDLILDESQNSLKGEAPS